jgi:predicted phosphodiesterase
MDKTIIDLGILKGKVLLFGGVYSNLQALQALKAKSEAHGIPPEQCICTGDIVGYCAQPEETIRFFCEWGAKSIAGNVELQLKDEADNCGCDFQSGSRCDYLSQIWYPYAQSQLSKRSLDFISTLPDHLKFNYAGKQVKVVHGSFSNVSEFIFKSTEWGIKQANFDATLSDVIIAGHCGLPFYHKHQSKLWLNSGVIGMPANDGGPHGWYVILEETDEGINYSYHKLTYDYKHANALMVKQNLPKAYAQTLLTGIWDNMDILPLEEKALQGQEIILD